MTRARIYMLMIVRNTIKRCAVKSIVLQTDLVYKNFQFSV